MATVRAEKESTPEVGPKIDLKLVSHNATPNFSWGLGDVESRNPDCPVQTPKTCVITCWAHEMADLLKGPSPK